MYGTVARASCQHLWRPTNRLMGHQHKQSVHVTKKVSHSLIGASSSFEALGFYRIKAKMKSLFSVIVTVMMLVGWVVYLAGIASSQDICVKYGKGELIDPIKSVDNPDKYVAIAGPWSSGFNAAAALSGASISGASSADQGSTISRKMLSLDPFLVPHGRSLLDDKVANGCGWSYSFQWWTVALEGLAVVGVIMMTFTSNETIHKLKAAFFAFIAVNTALLCWVASVVVPLTYNYNQVKAKGKAVDAVGATSAGVIITLIFNFMWFISSSLEDGGSVQPVAK